MKLPMKSSTKIVHEVFLKLVRCNEIIPEIVTIIVFENGPEIFPKIVNKIVHEIVPQVMTKRFEMSIKF